MESLKIIVDVAHTSSAVISDVISIAKRPILTSHTGAKGVCNNTRNLSDEHLKGIAKTGGIVGVAFFNKALCGNATVHDLVKTIKYIVDLIGEDHVAFGSDFDGAVSTPIDVRGIDQIIQVMLDTRFTEKQIEKIVGKNIVDFMLRNMP